MGSSKEAHIKSAPAYTLVGRHKPKHPPTFNFPGPGTYDNRYDAILNKPPQFSMGQRITQKEKIEGPGIGSHFPEKVETNLLTNFKLIFCLKSLILF